ncbi:MAG: GNAT family N-acetyltransferase [Pseudomonadota bacterium]
MTALLTRFRRRVSGTVRPLAEDDWVDLLRHARRLSGEDLYTRFNIDPSDDDLVHWARVSRLNDVFGWYVDDVMRASVEVGFRGERAECAVTVEEAFRHTGIGRRLFDHACEHARAQGASAMCMLTVCHGNGDIDRMLGRPGWSVSRSYARSIILPNREPENPLWLIRDLTAAPSLRARLARLVPGLPAAQD